MGTSVLPDMYTRSPRAAGPRDFFYGSPSRGSLYLATPLGKVTKFNVAQVSNWSKVPCSREQQQQNWAPLGIEPGTFRSPGQCSNHRTVDEGVHIRQNTSAHVATIMYHFNCEWVNICSNPRQSLHLYTEAC